jgi:hypothetical protein
MREERPDVNQPEYDSEDLINPLGWLKRQPYGKLKNWLRRALWNGKFLPVMIPSNVPPVSHLAQLLLRTDAEVKTSLRTIIPELLREWNAYDEPDCLLNLIILCGNLSCNEAETIIATIITEKLEEKPAHIKCRKEGLGILQSIGTERTVHLYKRYIDNSEYAAFCYRGLYLYDLTYAATELPKLIEMNRRERGGLKLKGILHLLFKLTLKPPQYITVVQSFADNASGEYFIEFLELLRSLDVLNDSFFDNLSKAENVKLLGRLMKQTPLEDSGRMVELLEAVGIEIEPPADSFNPEPDISKMPPPLTVSIAPLSLASMGKGRYFTYRPTSGRGESVPVVAIEELSQDQEWAYSRNYNPRGLDHLFSGH